MNGKLELWRQVRETDARYTRHVSQRGGFTAISAYWQIQRATEMWGPVGMGWGWDVEWAEGPGVVIARVALWHGARDQVVNAVGCAAWGSQRVDTDAPKKALTDGITKALSYLGFSADIFVDGKVMHDNKYVDQVDDAPAAPRAPQASAPAPAPQAEAAAPASSSPQPQGAGALTGAEPWLDWEIRWGQFKGQTYRQLATSAPDSRAASWMQWAVNRELDASNQYHGKNVEENQRFSTILAHIQSRGTDTLEQQLEDELDEVPF